MEVVIALGRSAMGFVSVSLPYSFSTLLDYVWLLVTKLKKKKNMAGHKHFKIYFNKDFSYELGI